MKAAVRSGSDHRQFYAWRTSNVPLPRTTKCSFGCTRQRPAREARAIVRVGWTPPSLGEPRRNSLPRSADKHRVMPKRRKRSRRRPTPVAYSVYIVELDRRCVERTVRFCPALRGADGALAGRTVRAAQGRWHARGSKTASLWCSAALRPDEGDWSVQDPVRKQKPLRWRSPARSRSEAIPSSGADHQPHFCSSGSTFRFTRPRNSRHLPRPRRPDHQTHADPKPRQHVDQCIGAEQVDATA